MAHTVPVIWPNGTHCWQCQHTIPAGANAVLERGGIRCESCAQANPLPPTPDHR